MRFSDSLDPASSSHKGVFKRKLAVYMGNSLRSWPYCVIKDLTAELRSK